jgi:hypothetical protein
VPARLDLVVGRGTDIGKWYKNGIRTAIGLDLESASINEAIRKYRTFRNKEYTDYTFYSLFDGKSFVETLRHARIPHAHRFSIVTCYFVGSEANFCVTLTTVVQVLAMGGVFIGTFEDSAGVDRDTVKDLADASGFDLVEWKSLEEHHRTLKQPALPLSDAARATCFSDGTFIFVRRF